MPSTWMVMELSSSAVYDCTIEYQLSYRSWVHVKVAQMTMMKQKPTNTVTCVIQYICKYKQEICPQTILDKHILYVFLLLGSHH